VRRYSRQGAASGSEVWKTVYEKSNEADRYENPSLVNPKQLLPAQLRVIKVLQQNAKYRKCSGCCQKNFLLICTCYTCYTTNFRSVEGVASESNKNKKFDL
jgi:hypothetical protein